LYQLHVMAVDVLSVEDAVAVVWYTMMYGTEWNDTFGKGINNATLFEILLEFFFLRFTSCHWGN
jgi:hypothetical protein